MKKIIRIGKRIVESKKKILGAGKDVANGSEEVYITVGHDEVDEPAYLVAMWPNSTSEIPQPPLEKKEALRDAFEAIAQEGGYPVYFEHNEDASPAFATRGPTIDNLPVDKWELEKMFDKAVNAAKQIGLDVYSVMPRFAGKVKKNKLKKKTGGIHAEPYKEIDLSEIGIDALEDLSGQGQKDQIADHWREALDFTVDPGGAREHLKNLGIDPEDVDEMDEDTLANYILWIIANDWYEDQEYYDIEDPDKRWWYFGE